LGRHQGPPAEVTSSTQSDPGTDSRTQLHSRARRELTTFVALPADAQSAGSGPSANSQPLGRLLGPRGETISPQVPSPGSDSSQSALGRAQSAVFPITPTTPADALAWGSGCQLGAQPTIPWDPYHLLRSDSTVWKIREEGEDVFLETRLADGRIALLLDIGSVGNLAGSRWIVKQAAEALKSGRKPEQVRRDRALSVSGVGNGSQECKFNCHLPLAVRCEGPSAQTSDWLKGYFKTPVVPDSPLPALLGLQSLTENRAVLNLITKELYILGPGEDDLRKHLPPGSKVIKCETAPSGHLMIPCAEFTGLDQAEKTGGLELQEVSLPIKSSVKGCVPKAE
jgi:hypothetical protein